MEPFQKYLLRYGEIGLKGKNRNHFTGQLKKNLSNAFKKDGPFRLKMQFGRIFLETPLDPEVVFSVLSKCFGVVSYSPVLETPLSFQAILDSVLFSAEEYLRSNPSCFFFKISARRANKSFEMNSFQLNRDLGAAVLERFPQLKAKMKDPPLDIRVEIREQNAYVFKSEIKTNGGLPVGISGKGLLLLSGGIDSPVAGWRMLKRGMSIVPIHFFSPPYTSVRSRQKVIDLSKLLFSWGGASRLIIIHFTPIQLKINQTSKKNLTTLLSRKAMMLLSDLFCQNQDLNAIVTGENLGQVASQTVESMTATECSIRHPVFRPLIGFDKCEIVDQARHIGSFDISILPYEDCCTLFLPEHPRIKPTVPELESEFSRLEIASLFEEALNGAETVPLD